MLDRPDWIAQADRAFDFIAQSMTRGERLGLFSSCFNLDQR
jgi:hypothetical protein